jgi:hypothetical protein
MTTIYDGGPANPIGNESGITFRDYFASAVMTGMYAAGTVTDMTASATAAYAQADAMLTVRQIAPVEETTDATTDTATTDATTDTTTDVTTDTGSTT